VSRHDYIERLNEHIARAVRLVLDEVHESVVGVPRAQERSDRPALAMNDHVTAQPRLSLSPSPRVDNAVFAPRAGAVGVNAATTRNAAAASLMHYLL
jgi:hypothetical protein